MTSVHHVLLDASPEESLHDNKQKKKKKIVLCVGGRNATVKVKKDVIKAVVLLSIYAFGFPANTIKASAVASFILLEKIKM